MPLNSSLGLRSNSRQIVRGCVTDSLTDFSSSRDMKSNIFHVDRTFERCRALWLLYPHVQLVELLCLANRSFQPLMGKGADYALPFPVRA